MIELTKHDTTVKYSIGKYDPRIKQIVTEFDERARQNVEAAVAQLNEAEVASEAMREDLNMPTGTHNYEWVVVKRTLVTELQREVPYVPKEAMPVKYGLSCRGCTTMVPCNPEGLAIAARHDESDECGRMKDREAEGWNLEVL